jgi:glycosyltransferase involved in cell wall biosynthesis
MALKRQAKLTVAIPVFNGERYLECALDSIASQTYQDFLVYVSDNASTDSTLDICRHYASLDPRINYVRHEENRGPSWNFRYLLSVAQTPCFMWAACDDLWHPSYIESCMSCLEADPGIAIAASLVVPFTEDIYRDPCHHLSALPGPTRWQTRGNFLRQPEEQGKANLIYGVFRTEVLQSVARRRLFDECWGADMLFVYRCLTKGRLYVVDRPLFFKRQESSPFASQPASHLVPADHERLALSALCLTLQNYGPYYWTCILVDARDTASPWVSRLGLMICAAGLLCQKLWLSLRSLSGMIIRHRLEMATRIASSLLHKFHRSH